MSNYEVWGRKTFREPYQHYGYESREMFQGDIPKHDVYRNRISTEELYQSLVPWCI
ncbi:hypothetical protein F511_07992 [Dorcoceras hygrometricum]|uniref:Uncharacterized protein n=1 Tax=Dorcoceras hygrometricum TaxID=472368 RepID=A0A2Z7BBN3_9LAMI|nr:hypothetical protein F511_07992 [Dorcoceras hygrometricum]